MKSIKIILLTSFFSLLSINAFASSGKVRVVTNEDESILLITGGAARELYNRLNMPSKNGFKNGREIKCRLTGEDEFSCTMKLEESDGSGEMFTGVVGQ